MDVGSHGRQRRREWVAIATLWLGGCASTCGEPSNPGAVGELGNGRFLYACLDESDPACASSPGSDDMDYFPECIALGGRFDLEYMLIDTSALESDELTPVLYVESVNQSFFGGDDDFQALRVGEAAFVVRESERVLDLIHLPIVEPDGIDVVAHDPPTPTTAIEIGVGSTEQLRVHPRSLDCLEIGGAVPFEADSSDEAVATVSAGGLLTIQGRAPGTTVVTVRLGELEQAITVEVVGSGTDTEPGTGSDGSGDTGSGTTGATDTGSGTSDGTGSGTTGGSSTGGGSTGGSTTGGT